jgi:hypothetical protein
MLKTIVGEIDALKHITRTSIIGYLPFKVASSHKD